MKLHEKGHIKELYVLVSVAMRGFIHRNMNYDAMFRTSWEIIANLSCTTTDKSVLKAIREIFEESDRVKFAKFIPPAELTSTIIDQAIEPVKTVLEQIEREKARIAEEQENLQTPVNDGQELVETSVGVKEGGF